MKKNNLKRNLVLGILFFLPVAFLLMLYPSTHNYNPLEIVDEKVSELQFFSSNTDSKIKLEDHITVLGFFGNEPIDNVIAASNLKELVYDKFKGFKKFQIVIVLPKGNQAKADLLQKEINNYEDMRFWHYVYGEPNDIQSLFQSLKTEEPLDDNLSTDHIFIVDKDLKQRGRLDDRNKTELENNSVIYPLYSYDCIEVDEMKNKMSDDLRILFTEYRQKRKGKFDSSSRRAQDLNTEDN
ncbi:hypothetical protein SAMN04515667_0198 [Formosa sp. Hel1_31_208]|uniref:hypothetical protein n=1 Tax=Formosa sp. Hel1_31_208 TaxID=1798225 RepID=UPI00087933ED|nr:hypothetical protein [Formosa sp. Hel1_31_208]SDR67323.1 hypothetical protein SAMN04515667_0198 [Formosa sp. Hel1_31_208]